MSDGVIYVFVLIFVEVCEKFDSLCKINIILRFLVMVICILKKWFKILWFIDFVEIWGRYLICFFCFRINCCMMLYRKWCNVILLVLVFVSGELDLIWIIICMGLDLMWLLVFGRVLGLCLVGISGMLGYGWIKLVNYIWWEILVFLLY